jgi:hypothetical protein
LARVDRRVAGLQLDGGSDTRILLNKHLRFTIVFSPLSFLCLAISRFGN